MTAGLSTQSTHRNFGGKARDLRGGIRSFGRGAVAACVVLVLLIVFFLVVFGVREMSYASGAGYPNDQGFDVSAGGTILDSHDDSLDTEDDLLNAEDGLLGLDTEGDRLTILNPLSHPKAGDIWEIRFETVGVDDLTITLEDEQTVSDVEFVGLYCGETEVQTFTASNTVQRVEEYHCDGVSSIKHLVNIAGSHAVGIQYGDEKEIAHNAGIYEWARRLGGTSYDFGHSVAVDSSDNIVVTGRVSGNVDLNGDGDSTDGGAEDSTGYGGQDVFVSVFDSSGVHQWARRLGGTSNDYEHSVAVDSSDNIVVTGYVYGNADLNGDGDSTDGGAEDSTGYGGYDVFITVFDSSGVHQWARRLGGTSHDGGYSVTVNSLDNIIVTGAVIGNADLNGDGDSTDGGAEDGTGYGGMDVFISVFNSSGVHQWARRLGGSSDYESGSSVAVDSLDSIVVTGNVSGNVDLNGDGDSTDGGAEDGTGYGGQDVFVSVFDSSGVHQWARRLGGTSGDYGSSVAVDSSDNIVVTGRVSGDADLNGDGDFTDGGAESATGYGGSDVFISVFNSSGVHQWAKRLGGMSNDGGSSVAVDSSDNIVVTGYVSDNADLNGDGDSTDGGAEDSTGYGSSDVFITVFDSSGVHQWVRRLGGTSTDDGGSVAVDSLDTIVVTGYVTGNADLNGDGDSTDGGAEDSTGYGSYDVFISVFKQDLFPPEGEIEIDGGSTITNTRAVTLGIHATDEKSGVREMMVCNIRRFSGCTWELYGTTKSWTLTAGDGTKTVYVKFKDEWGNVSSTYSDTIVLDTVPPLVAITYIDHFPLVTSVRWLINRRPLFEGTTEPNTAVRVRVESAGISDWLTSDGEGNWTWQPEYALPLGIHEVVVTTWDEAGNSGSDNVTLVVLLSFGTPVDAEEGEEEEEGQEEDEDQHDEKDKEGDEQDDTPSYVDAGGDDTGDDAGNEERITIGTILGDIVETIFGGEGVVSEIISSTTDTIREINRSTAGTVSAISLLTVAAVTGGAEVAAVAGMSVVHVPLLFTNSFLWGLLGITRRRKPWGVVYDSVTKEPLSRAVVRVYRSEELSQTTVTDINGVFTVDLEPGSYTLLTQKGSYVFPTKIVTGDTDGNRSPIYHGGPVTAPEEGTTLSTYVPVDPEGAGAGGRILAQARSQGSTIFGWVMFGFLIFGVVFSFWSFLVVGGMWYLLLTLLNLLMLAFNLSTRLSTPGSWGRVVTEDGEVVSGLEVGLYDYTYGKLIDNRVTDDEGRYRFIAPGGRYWIRPVGGEYALVRYSGKGGVEVGEETDRSIVLSEKLVVRGAGEAK